MGTGFFLDADRMLEIEAGSVVGAAVDIAGNLTFTRHDGSVINAGNVKGPTGELPSMSIAYRTASAAPSTYPVGLSYFPISAIDDWPGNVAVVNTTRQAAFRTVQTVIQKITGRMWVRSEGDTDNWGDWQAITAAATPAEAIAGTNTFKAVTPEGLKSFFNNVGSLTTQDLNSVTLKGVYNQGTEANALLARNYPVATVGGILEVLPGTSSIDIVQTYHTRSGTNGAWSRVARSGVWSAWRQVWAPNTVFPAFQAKGTGTLVKGSAASYVALILGVASLNSGNHYDTATGRFTAPYDGIYEFSASFTASTSNGGPEMALYKNGILAIGNAAIQYSTAYNTAGGSWRMALVAGDFVQPYMQNNNDVSVTIDRNRSHFGGHLLKAA